MLEFQSSARAARRSACALIAAVASLAALPAAAADVRFTITNDLAPGSVSWLLPEAPTPSFGVPDYFFGLDGPVIGTYQGAAEGDGQVLFEVFAFLVAGAGGGLSSFAFIALDDGGPPDFNIPYGFELIGDQLFTGTTDAPTFRLGTFTLVDACFCNPGVGTYSLTISAAGSDPVAVPEPATWTLLILGFGGIGALLRRRALAPHNSET
jgi:hypothetical protein